MKNNNNNNNNPEIIIIRRIRKQLGVDTAIVITRLSLALKKTYTQYQPIYDDLSFDAHVDVY